MSSTCAHTDTSQAKQMTALTEHKPTVETDKQGQH